VEALGLREEGSGSGGSAYPGSLSSQDSQRMQQLTLMLDELKARGDEGCRNVVSCLVMSSEFLFLQ
jgi:hypothetical protein